MTRNDLKVSARRLANDAEQLRGRQRSLVKLGNGTLKEKWKAEDRALELAIEALEQQVKALTRQAEEVGGPDATHLGKLEPSPMCISRMNSSR